MNACPFCFNKASLTLVLLPASFLFNNVSTPRYIKHMFASFTV